MGLIHGGVQHWVEQGDGIDSWGLTMGARYTGWIGAMGVIYGVCHGGVRHRLDRGDGIDLWGCIMGVHDWIGVMGMICGGVPWGSVTLAGSGRWDWFMGAHDTGWIGAMGLIHGGSRHWLDRGDGNVICGGAPWGRATLAGPGRWDWLMGVCYGNTWHCNGEMVLIYGNALWGRATWSGRWDWFVVAQHGGVTQAGSGRWDWFMGAHHGGAWHWLDLGNGIDSWRRAEWQSTIWLLNSNDDTMCPHIWRWGKCTECAWLRGW